MEAGAPCPPQRPDLRPGIGVCLQSRPTAQRHSAARQQGGGAPYAPCVPCVPCDGPARSTICRAVTSHQHFPRLQQRQPSPKKFQLAAYHFPVIGKAGSDGDVDDVGGVEEVFCPGGLPRGRICRSPSDDSAQHQSLAAHGFVVSGIALGLPIRGTRREAAPRAAGDDASVGGPKKAFFQGVFAGTGVGLIACV